jgi:hypothetical protein
MPDRGKALVAVLACVLSRLVQANDAVRSTNLSFFSHHHKRDYPGFLQTAGAYPSPFLPPTTAIFPFLFVPFLLLRRNPPLGRMW